MTRPPKSQPDNREYAKHRQRKFKKKKRSSGYEQMTIFVSRRQRKQMETVCTRKGVAFVNQSETTAFMFNLAEQFVELEQISTTIRAITQEAEAANKAADTEAVGAYLREISGELRKRGIAVGEAKNKYSRKQEQPANKPATFIQKIKKWIGF